MHKDLCRYIGVVAFGLIVLYLTGCVTVEPRPWTKAEKGLLVSSLFTSAADCYTTERMLDKGFSETNFFLGSHPSDGNVVVYFGLVEAGAIFAGHYIPKLRPWILGGVTAVNGYGAINNYGLMTDD